METKSKFEELRGIDVSAHIEKKNGLSYLSWAWAIDQLLLKDPAATWDFHEPTKVGETFMVWVSVTAFGKTNKFPLPVMDHRNKAIQNPDAFQLNTAYMRCLAKCIATHGLGLYIYAGEDVPEAVREEQANKSLEDLKLAVSQAESDELIEIWKECRSFRESHPDLSALLLEAIQSRKEQLSQPEKPKRKAA
jgi:hypothetical protein